MTSTEQTEQDRVTNAATIAALVDLAVRDGILTPAAPMNGTGTDYVSVGTGDGDGVGSKDVRIGTLSKAQYGTPARVYVDVRLAHRQGQTHETTDHRTVSDYWELSICGATTTAASRRRDDIDSGGQCRDIVAMVTNGPEFLPGFVKAWDIYHLSGMNAACDHQVVVWEDSTYGRRPSLTATRPCPLTGYRYGSKWLVRDLPADVAQTVLAFLRQAKDK